MNVRNSKVMSFDIGKTINYWLESAVYDFETGKSLLESKKFPYALFFAHLAIEKVLKAIVVKQTGEHAPYIHSLVLLVKKANIKMTEEMLDQLAEYMEFHIEARYPDEKKDFYKKCTEEFTRKKIAEMDKVYKWLTQKLDK
jgi:HEPN domain-containing protein